MISLLPLWDPPLQDYPRWPQRPKSFWGRWLVLRLLAGLLSIVVASTVYLVICPFVRLPPTGWLLLGGLLGALGYALALVALYLTLADWLLDAL